MMGRRRGFLPPATCQQCGKTPDLGRHLWPGDRWRCIACLEEYLPGIDCLSKSSHKIHEYADEIKTAFDLESEGSRAEGPRNRAEWAKTVAYEIEKEGLARAKTIKQAHGEVLPPPDKKFLHDTLAVPDLAAVEASLERSRLLLDYGTDVVAMALDTSASIKAENSLEKMLAHELAAAHKMVMEQIGRARGGNHRDTDIKRLHVATRFMTVFQQGMLTLKKLRQGGQQKITVQYVNVSHGSQAVIGNVPREGQ
ncbi:MAG: hypothetical protein ABIQ24_02340 [Nitrospiraceae bacterium]